SLIAASRVARPAFSVSDTPRYKRASSRTNRSLMFGSTITCSLSIVISLVRTSTIAPTRTRCSSQGRLLPYDQVHHPRLKVVLVGYKRNQPRSGGSQVEIDVGEEESHTLRFLGTLDVRLEPTKEFKSLLFTPHVNQPLGRTKNLKVVVVAAEFYFHIAPFRCVSVAARVASRKLVESSLHHPSALPASDFF